MTQDELKVIIALAEAVVEKKNFRLPVTTQVNALAIGLLTLRDCLEAKNDAR